MHDHDQHPDPGISLVAKARERVMRFEQDVDEEPWKRQHQDAMRCYALEDTLARGIALYDSLIGLDMALRKSLLQDPNRSDMDTANTLEMMEMLLSLWLGPCKRVAKEIASMEKLGFEVRHADEFRKRYEEAVWITSDDALDCPAMVTARDEAIDDLRAGNAH